MSTGPFPSSLAGRAPTLAELQVELGSENANSLVSKIGELARAHGLGSHAGMNGTVDRVIGSLTLDERRLMSQSSYVPPRVDAIINAEAETAKAQQRQNEDAARRDSNPHAIIPFGKDAAMGRGGPLAALWNLSGSDGRGSSSSQSGSSAKYDFMPSNGSGGYSSDTRILPNGNLYIGGQYLTPGNFNRSEYGHIGYRIDTVKALVRENFNGEQIKIAGQDSKSFHLDPNRYARPFAHLDRINPQLRTERNGHLKQTDQGYGEVNSMLEQWKKADPAKRAEIESTLAKKWGSVRNAEKHLLHMYGPKGEPWIRDILKGLIPILLE